MNKLINTFSRKAILVDFPTRDEAIRVIATTLDESSPDAYRRITEIVDRLGVPAALELLQQTEAIEEQGGMFTKDNSRRRTPGGVFFLIARKAVPEVVIRRRAPRNDAAEATTTEIARLLGETDPKTLQSIKQIVHRLGIDVAMEKLREALDMYNRGESLTSDDDSPSALFFTLVREGAPPREPAEPPSGARLRPRKRQLRR